MSYSDFFSQNQRYVDWFADYSTSLEGVMGLRPVLTGSRSFCLAYPESDLECAFIVSGKDKQNELYEKLLEHYRQSGLSVTGTKTKAGLLLITVKDLYKDDSVNVYKFEVTFRTPEQQQKIQDHIQAGLARMTEEEKLSYILGARKDFLANDVASYNKRKEWLRVL